VPADHEASPATRNREVPTRQKTHWSAHFIRFRFVAFLAILAAFAWILFAPRNPAPEPQPDEIEQQRLMLFNGLKIWRALHEFQKKHGTDTAPFPSDIHQLDEMGVTDDIRSLLAVKPQFAGDWLYFSAADSENKQAPLFVSPILSRKTGPPHLQRQLVVTVGGSVQILDSEAAEKRVKESPTPPERFPAPVVP